MEKISNRITLVLFLSLLFGFSLAFFVLPDRTFSEEENRSLRTYPSFSWKELATGAYSEKINEYFADQFPARDLFVGIKATAELSLGKGENNGVLLGRDGQLARRLFDVTRADGSIAENLDQFDPVAVLQAAQGINRAAHSVGVPFSVLFTGRTLDVTATSFSYPNDSGNALREFLQKELDPSVSYIETVPLLAEKHRLGEYVYYKTDHHWTTLGAYYAYAQVMRSFGMEEEILPPSAFEKHVVSERFYGTAWSKSGMKFVSPDRMDFWMLGNEDSFAVTADGKMLEGMYSTAYLAQKDQYSAFLDGTHDIVTVKKKDGTARPTLLLFKDSFANSLAPFLAQHFDLVLLNLSSARTDFSDTQALVKQYKADRVLLVYTLENVVGATKLQKFH